ncbi:MAG: DUF58 domain-containing protein [Oscillospiraceae bacterium]|nr:DUF58 domain-containing protein [Oscillospiraceae bacterium]MDD4413809.1 DUF58 domain-containing protein [Oscillospiraceae bacterium]
MLLFALLLILGLATGSGEIFFGVFLTGMVFVFALSSAVAGILVLRFVFSISDKKVNRGNAASIILSCRGMTLLPVIMKIKLILPGDKLHLCAAQIWGIKHKPLRFMPLCPHRGVWKTGIKSLCCSDIFGLFSFRVPASHYANSSVQLTVYPCIFEIHETPPLPVPVADYMENNLETADHGDSFADTRLYRDGDPLKRIHWKLSLRTRTLHTRKYEMSADRMAAVVIDTSKKPECSPELPLNYADMATECASSLAYFYFSAGLTVHIYTSDDLDNILINTKDEFIKAHTMLASAEFDTDSSVLETVSRIIGELSYFSALNVITHSPTPELIELLSRVTDLRCRASIICPDLKDNADIKGLLSNDIRTAIITRPHDISERLGDCV